MTLKIQRSHWRRHPAVRSGDELTVGERTADAVVSAMGSWQFIIWQTAIVGLWITVNLLAFIGRWDPYPFILLNLVFSTQAAYASPLIMMAGNRADKKRAELAQHDYETNQRSEEKIDRILGALKVE